MKNFAQEVYQRCDILASFSENDANITRRFLTAPMKKTHQQVSSWMQEVGLTVSVDALGNIIGKKMYSENAPTIIMGSHLDTVINAGKYDGILGCLLPLTLLKILQEKKIPIKKNIEIIGFSDEEGTRYKKNFLGSLGRIGEFPLEYLKEKDLEGMSMEEAITDFGLDVSKINKITDFEKGDFFLEIHTEQGFVLQKEGKSLGIVDGIVGQTHWLLEFEGKSNHAGTCLMPDRQDSLACAAEAIFFITQEAKNQQGLVATCGQINNYPNSINVISEKTTVSLDVRHYDNAIKEQFLEKVKTYLQALAVKNNIRFQKKLLGEKKTVECSAAIKNLLDKSFQKQNITDYHLVSGAGHDAMIMAKKVPMAMLFLRSPNGVSHHPSEIVEIADIEQALSVLTEFFCSLDELTFY